MTTLEIILLISLYIIVGIWICFKRDWYISQLDEFIEGFFINVIAIVFMPLNLILIIFKELILRKWDNQ